MRFLGRKEHIFYAGKTVERKRERKKRRQRLIYSIYGVPSVGIRRAKSESSFTRRGLRVSTKNEGFH